MSPELLKDSVYRDFAPIWSALRGHRFLWHQTPLKQLEAILCDGAIRPNTGEFPPNYSQSKNSYAWHLGAVAIFDFDSWAEDEIKNAEWKDVLFGRNGPGVLICIAADALDERKLLTPDAIAAADSRLDILPEAIRCGHGLIPHVEAFYLDKIPASAIRRFYLTSLAGALGYLWHPVEANKNVLSDLKAGTDLWIAGQRAEAASPATSDGFGFRYPD